MERWLAKVLSLTIIFSLSVAGSLLPIKVAAMFLRWGATGRRVLSYMMCYSGGVFFAIFLLHMGPEARGIVEESLIFPYNINYPLSELFISVGFFFMVILEKSVEKLHHKPTKKEQGKGEPQLRENGVHAAPADEPMLAKHEGQGEDAAFSVAVTTFNGDLKHSEKISEEPTEEELNAAGVGHVHELTGTRSLILLLALSLHHVFEGMSVGLKETISSVWSLTIAIVSHEVVIAFSLGLQLVRSFPHSRAKVVIAGVTCQIMTPIGILIGLALIETGSSEHPTIQILNGILQSMSTGVFIYVTFFEILSDELQGEPNMMKIFFMLVGFGTMALLMMISESPLPVPHSPINCTDFNITNQERLS